MRLFELGELIRIASIEVGRQRRECVVGGAVGVTPLLLRQTTTTFAEDLYTLHDALESPPCLGPIDLAGHEPGRRRIVFDEVVSRETGGGRIRHGLRILAEARSRALCILAGVDELSIDPAQHVVGHLLDLAGGGSQEQHPQGIARQSDGRHGSDDASDAIHGRPGSNVMRHWRQHPVPTPQRRPATV